MDEANSLNDSRLDREMKRIVALPTQTPGIEFWRSIVCNRFPPNVDRCNTVGFMNRSG
ncbi:MAG: hypothetical protein GXP31_14850 [Kiritimatiellaeota bacterium]|nr:hypothetical protein [Kiritimatiellota bacterium]